MQLTSSDFKATQPIPERFAFGKFDPQTHIALSSNVNPELGWRDAPAGTQSFALLCVDPDAPSVGEDVNREHREVKADLPRVDFYHLVMIDIPKTVHHIERGSIASRITPRGLQNPNGPGNSRFGLNDYTGWFANDAEMAGNYFGYDGPCPPWNDLRLHHYHFRLYALDVAHLAVPDIFTGSDALSAMRGHVLAEAEHVGTYTLNPKLRG